MNPDEYINKILQTKDFNEKIKLRIEFKEKYPEEFEKYMKELPNQKQRPPLCYACKHFVKGGDCELNLWPIGNVFKDVVNYPCQSFEKK
ncbi:hypothetical protein A3F02_01225 [Candidatus Curtissbacteria bacterium RIFCSPHIGHO2_12_FULL_38_9b]|uniref:Uncharacterized protein n=1 Tax=Candidatus Curtissbacteria bacterium RIFCSPHIGHO2_12_FULL_38_9b TaxID=1797720 RepID=A0A1F5GZR7_9BACT|nr:MAG: hypothetical protein A3F02_01225 [Candidatus Curtissbacteria bacterium RIFCSPHIGHO2_12_FULL_38_9b]